MNIDEAMTGLSIQREVKTRLGKNREADAIQLGIEALKRLQNIRSYTTTRQITPLPSETEAYCNFCGLAHPGIECPDRERGK